MGVQRGNVLTMLEPMGLKMNHIIFFDFLIRCAMHRLKFTIAKTRLVLPDLVSFTDKHGRSIPRSSAYRLMRRYQKYGAVFRDFEYEREIDTPIQIFMASPYFAEFLRFLFDMFTRYYSHVKESGKRG